MVASGSVGVEMKGGYGGEQGVSVETLWLDFV